MPYMSQSPSTTELDDIVRISPPAKYVALASTDSETKVKLEPVDGLRDPLDQKPELTFDVGKQVKQQVEEVDMQKMVEQTVKRVREQSDRLQSVAKPYADRTRSLAEARPVLFTFLAIFTALSFIPLACFAGFVLSATVFFIGVAVVGVLVSVLFTVVLSSSFLLPVLFFTCLVSISILSFLLSLFLVHRLYLHLATSTKTASGHQTDYAHLSRGVKAWIDETSGRLPEVGLDLSSINLGSLNPRAKGAEGERVVIFKPIPSEKPTVKTE